MVRVSRLTEHLLLNIFIATLVYYLPQYFIAWFLILVIAWFIFLLPILLTELFYNIPKLRISTKGKAVFITGCDSGFGHELAKRLFSLGITVFAGCLSTESPGAKKLKSVGSKLIVLPLDVTKDDSVKSALEIVKTNLGNNILWGVVNNAGIAVSNYVEMQTMEEFRKVYEVNVFGVLRVTKAFLPLLRASHGRLVFLASEAGRITSPNLCAYAMTKHSIVSLSDGIRFEVAKFGIKVSTIEPGFHKTAIIDEEPYKKEVSAAYNNCDQDIITAYGSSSLEQQIKRFQMTINEMASDKIWRVVDMLEDALLSPFPFSVYDACSFKNLLLFFFSMASPKILLGYFMEKIDQKALDTIR